MDPQELLTRPASTLTRKQRRDRAALKRQIAAQLQVPVGYALGTVRVVDPLPELPPPASPAAQLKTGRLHPRDGTVMVRMIDVPPYAVGKP